MITNSRPWFPMVASAFALGFASTLAAQPAAADVAPAATPWWTPLISTGGIVTLVLLVVVAAAIILFMAGRRPRVDVDGYFSENEMEGSKYEQLLAEIQGLSLRVKNGEGKGDFRKIEKLVRVFLERSGFIGVRKMTDEQLMALLAGGQVPQAQASSLASIIERCKRGAQSEHEKLDFSALELLRELRELVWANETPPAHKSA
ncbi:MAG TPA: hypothetical protein PK847_03605 [Candidatus Sumerlaeota bacterium]|nr:MAG: hypothetical protein BWZ08_01310 [candidate division BRC1 bacterium ADurb.BinA292]HOE95651.1 hypothetical protein [Candidatus Sumerlaeota bacterium]HOR27466.1 hypothetical protein [Candidatus Sumerlaeota bacterium]